MKKIYSFVLMATMLLVGTSIKAATTVVNPGDNLQDMIAAAEDGDEFVFNQLFETSNSLWLGTGKHIKFILNANYQYNGTNAVAIAVTHGTLEIQGTTGKKIMSSATNLEDLIRIYGTTDEIDAIDPDAAWSRVIVGQGIELKSTVKNVLVIDVFRPDQPAKFGQTATGDLNYTCVYNGNSSNFGFANGARFDIYGTVTGKKYGIKVNGMVRDPQEWNLGVAKRAFTPYVYIHEDAEVTTDDTETNAVAAYSSGYARWRIEGTCTGATGVYAKSGDVVIDGGKITSNSDYQAPNNANNKSGVQASGSAIVIESNANYSGNVSVTIAGNATVQASTGYAIQETLNNNTSGKTEVENITVVSGTISGGNKGAIIVTQETVNDTNADVVILGGNISSTDEEEKPLQIEGSTATEQAIINQLIPNGYQGTTPQAQTTDKDTEDQKTSIVIKTGYMITLNASGLATFSANETTNIPSGLTLYRAKYDATGEEVDLYDITSNAYLKDHTGVIAYGTPYASYNMVINNNVNAPAVADNDLFAASAWTGAKDYIYVLVGNEFIKYEGDLMKANKAYLDLNGPATQYGAPQRIRMAIAQEEQTEAVSNVEATTVKAVKFVENGEILIRRGENVYNLQGQIVK